MKNKPDFGFFAKIAIGIVNQKLNMGRDIIDDFLSKIKYRKVLDLGAGNGDDLLIAQKYNSGAELYAIENYDPCIRNLADKKINCLNLNLEKDSLPFKSGEIDVIIANQILEHTKELFWIFHEVSRTLKPGGFFIVGVPNLASFHNRIMLLAGRQPTCVLPYSAHVRGFTKEGMKKFAAIGNLKLIKSEGSNFYPFPAPIARILSKIFPGFSVGMFLLFKKESTYDDAFLRFPSENKLATNFFVGKKQDQGDEQ